MFWRVLLLAYFSTGAAWGPAFCCCRVQQLLERGAGWLVIAPPSLAGLAGDSARQSAGTTCPRCRAAAEAEENRSRCCREGWQQQPPVESECPCRERGSRAGGLWSFAFAEQQLLRGAVSADMPEVDFGHGRGVGVEPASSGGAAFESFRDPPFLLFGRALLRAYQTLNC